MNLEKPDKPNNRSKKNEQIINKINAFDNNPTL